MGPFENALITRNLKELPTRRKRGIWHTDVEPLPRLLATAQVPMNAPNEPDVPLSGNPTYRDLTAWSEDNFRVAEHPHRMSFSLRLVETLNLDPNSLDRGC